MYDYTCYGLHIRSEVRFPEFRPAAATFAAASPDVEVRLGRVDRPRPPANPNGADVSVTDGETHFFWEQAGHYLVSLGRSVTVDPAPGVEEDLYRLPLLGVVFGALLSQRGFEVLHASAVNVGGVVVGLVGEKGMGKSTTAAAFHHAGYQAVSDDVVAARYDGGKGRVMVAPGFPHLKLWPHAVGHVGGDAESLAPLHSRVTKRAFHLDGEFPTTLLPLKRLYLLGWGDETRIEPMSMSEAFAAIVPHSFIRRYAPDSPQTTSRLLRSCSTLVREVPVRHLVRKPDLEQLRQIVSAVEEDLALAVAA